VCAISACSKLFAVEDIKIWVRLPDMIADFKLPPIAAFTFAVALP
jgi:hypothetical protein